MSRFFARFLLCVDRRNGAVSEDRGMYELYQPLRTFLRSVSLLESLKAIWAYFQNLQFNQPFPPDVQVDQNTYQRPRPERGIYEWELELLVKELILNAPERGQTDLRVWNSLAQAVNLLKELE